MTPVAAKVVKGCLGFFYFFILFGFNFLSLVFLSVFGICCSLIFLSVVGFLTVSKLLAKS